MANLQTIGIAQRAITSPLMFEATPIEQALNSLVECKQDETENLKKMTKSLIRTLEKTQTAKIGQLQPEPEMYLIPATKLAVEKRKEIILNAEHSIDIINSWKRYKFFLGFNELTRKMVNQGVKFRFIVEVPTKMRTHREQQEALEILKENGSELKYIKHVPSAIISIYDNRETLIAMSQNAGPYDTPVLWSNNKSIVAMAKSYFENLWQNLP
jgi:sugar-specific transcriptional regulator TrmB